MTIYDCFMFNGEMDILEIRLNILDKYVDYFVLAESTQTFSGKEKPLYYLENKERFNKWNHKIIHHIIPPRDFSDSFKRAAFQKESIRKCLTHCNPNDLIYYGDVDEIWNPNNLETYGKMRQFCYSYFLNNRSSEDWQGTNVCKYSDLYDLNEWRANHDVVIENGGWHFTNMGGYDELIRKIESYDHQEVNIPWVKDGLKMRMDANIDFLGRGVDWKGNPFKFWLDEKDLPSFVLTHKERYKNLWR